MTIKIGDPVEFTLGYYENYPPEDKSVIKFGIAIEDERQDRTVKVRMADRTEIIVKYIHAYAWIGWLPEGLDLIQNELYFGNEVES